MGFYTSTDLLARKFARTRFAPMVRDVPSLRALVPQSGRGKGTSMFYRPFPGGHLNISGAGSASALASDPLDVAILDEVDRMLQNVGDEGNPRDQAIARTKNSLFRKIVSVSSPADEATSVIAPLYRDGTQENWYIPCPHCGHFHKAHWDHVRYKDTKGNRIPARFVCPQCHKEILERERMAVIAAGKPVEENKNPKPGVRSGFVNELYSPWRTLDELVNDYERVKDKPEKLHVFWATVLGYLWKNKGDAPPWEQVYDLRESYPIGTIPHKSIVLLTAFVDYQLADGGRLELEIMGWNRHGEAWSIQYDVLPGADKWHRLSEYLQRTWQHPNGSPMSLRGLGIDSGAGTKDVYEWVKKHPRERVFATKGASNFGAPALGAFKLSDYYSRDKKKLGSQRVWMIGSSTLKLEIYSRLRLRPEGDKEEKIWPPGFIHHPEYPEEFFQQRTVETLRWVYGKNGMKKPVWEKPPGKPNEALDTAVGNRAVYLICGAERFSAAQWDELEKQYGETPSAPRQERKRPLPIRRHSAGGMFGGGGGGRMFGDSD